MFPNYIIASSGIACCCKWLDLRHGVTPWLMLKRILNNSVWKITSFHYPESVIKFQRTLHSLLKYIWLLNFWVSDFASEYHGMIKKLPPGIASVCDETELNNWASYPRNISA